MDPDVPYPSIEGGNESLEQVAPSLTTTISREATTATISSRPESSPSRTPFKTPRSHPATPASRNGSRSPSVVSSRDEKRPRGPERTSSISGVSAARSGTPGSQMQYRRASSILNPAAAVKMKAPTPDNILQRRSLTSADVAEDYFQKEMDWYTGKDSKVAVFVHDSCYGHRFSRPRTSKSNLSLIVERPERIHATLLGVSTAYVRLGDRHKDGKHSPHPDRDITKISKPPFDLRKTSRSVPLNHPAVTHVHGTKWMEELQIMCDSADAKLAMNQKETSRPIGYGKDEKGNALPPLHSGDLYLSSESLAALQGCLGGVCDAVDTVFQSELTRRAFVCIRPPGHHCSSNIPSGFCWLNNVHVGITYAAMTHGLTHAAIIDFDLHHGDGSQTIAWNHNRNAQSVPKNAGSHKKIPIGYYSLHDINSFPCEWGDDEKVQNASLCIHQAHGQSIWNVHLEAWKNQEDFWRLYNSKYKVLLTKTRGFLRQHSETLRRSGIQPKAAIFLSAGFDASQWEGEGMQRHKVNVPTDFYARFTADVVDLAEEPDLAVDGRVVSVLEGGYSNRALTSGVLSHVCGLMQGVDVDSPAPSNQTLSGEPNDQFYDSAWWDIDNLQQLEALVEGRLPPPQKAADKPLGSYSSPTQASTARMTDVARERRSLSAQLEARLLLDNAPPEPPPELDWANASYELSRLLIPKDRQTLSCTHEDLNAEATRVKKERHSLLVATASGAEEGRQLRDRKTKPAQLARPISRDANRRSTIAAVTDLPDPSMREASTDRPRRRSSAASNILSSFQDLKLEDEEPKRNSRPSSRQGPDVSADATAMQVPKKVRAAPKKTSSRPNSPRKAKAPAPAPAIQKLASTKGKQKQKMAGSEASTLQSRQNNSSDIISNDGVNELTNGMKKITIKLNMPPEDQHEAAQKVVAQDKLSKPKVVRKPSSQKVAKIRATPTDTAPRNVSNPAPIKTLPAEVTANADTIHGQPMVALPMGSAALANHNQVSIDNGNPSAANLAEPEPLLTNFGQPVVPKIQTELVEQTIGHQFSEGNPIPGPFDAMEASVSIPPSYPHSASEPSSKGTMTPTRRDLPVFTSSSPIPFAKKKEEPGLSNNQNQQKPNQQVSSIWDIPDTPHQ